jgi:hypothetical protein
MRQRLRGSLALFGITAVFCLGMVCATTMLRPLDRIGQFWGNPFNISTQITPSGPTVLEQVQRLNRLESCRYNGQVIVRGDSSGYLPSWLVGDRILFVGHGEVIAGVDLSRLQSDSVRVEDKRVSIKLPAAEILSTSLDNRKSEVHERQTGIFSQPQKDLESKVRSEAEDRIQQAALTHGILQTATVNAQEALRSQMVQLGFQEIHFT